ncbi:MAG: bifunctional folylpolyglutamate synthase/dihydrofolate synthase [Acidobacteria bacterium]|nr:bifunctional folylpolyglutamate synthase/dihydrofolate synthase [Acidobacteriota bacterium]
MTYATAMERLAELGHELGVSASRKFSLDQMRALASALGHPERRFASVLVAGTNGKGSTAATLAAILQAAGYHTGLYTSPHLVRVNERIRVDGETISDSEFAEMYGRVEQVAAHLEAGGELPQHPSFFETVTTMAFEYFASVGVHIAVLEVGMGGRLDATNIVEPCLAVITDIALDHQKFLGNTIAEIAREKAGIIRPNGVVITLPQHPQANDVIGAVALQRNARAVSAVPYVPPVSPNAAAGLIGARSPYRLAVLDREILVDSPLVGRHQLRNIALAIASAVEIGQYGFPVSADAIERGIRATRWPGRFQVLRPRPAGPAYVLDVAHNPAGAWALRAALSEVFDGRELIVVFGAMRDKAVGEMAEILFPLASRVVLTQAAGHYPRAASPEELRAAAVRTGAEIVTAANVPAALHKAQALAASDSVIVVTGSIYIVGEAMEALECA